MIHRFASGRIDSGKFSIDAKYQGMNGDKVVLAKSDGKRIEVPTAKLSDEDARICSK